MVPCVNVTATGDRRLQFNAEKGFYCLKCGKIFYGDYNKVYEECQAHSCLPDTSVAAAVLLRQEPDEEEDDEENEGDDNEDDDDEDTDDGYSVSWYCGLAFRPS